MDRKRGKVKAAAVSQFWQDLVAFLVHLATKLKSSFRAVMATNQELQNVILQTLDREGSIADTSKIVLPSQSDRAVEQQQVQAVLSSLASRNVRVYS